MVRWASENKVAGKKDKYFQSYYNLTKNNMAEDAVLKQKILLLYMISNCFFFQWADAILKAKTSDNAKVSLGGICIHLSNAT